MTQERRPSKLVFDYSLDELDIYSGKVIADRLVSIGKKANEQSINNYKEKSKDTFLLVDEGKKGIVLEWFVIRHEAVQLLLKEKEKRQ